MESIETFTAQRASSKILQLKKSVTDPTVPQITGIDVLPEHGMNIFQIYAHLPNRGEIPLLYTSKAASEIEGNQSFKMGGAFLVPFANRIRGKASVDGRRVTAQTGTSFSFNLPANWPEEVNSSTEKVSMHGLILNTKMDQVELQSDSTLAKIKAVYDAGDFHGQWVSQTRLEFAFELHRDHLKIQIQARNKGDQTLPMSIGWHPYFVFPSGNRAQAQISLPVSERVLVNNYTDVFPTGAVERVEGTAYDFRPARKKELGHSYLDDCFIRDLSLSGSAEIRDSEAGYGLQLYNMSPEIKAFQIYAPPQQNFIGLEPQFNLGDPFNREIWGEDQDTGVVYLKPGETTQYQLELRLINMT